MPDQPRLRTLPPDKPLRLRNETCIYCGCTFGEGRKRTKEHVVARRSVPGGSFSRQWNLIAWACEPCNGEKSKLEGELSAVTMQADALGRYAADDERLAAEADRKGRGAVSSRTGKPVADSREQFTVAGELFGGDVTFGFVGPPQILRRTAEGLAHMQVKAFFYLITYDWSARRGGWPPGSVATAAMAFKTDWGNARLRGFQSHVAGWGPRVHAVAADGYFKMVIRRREDADVWAWAIEWNKNLRIAGFVGDEVALRHDVAALPEVARPGGVRAEVPLSDVDDTLFDPPTEDPAR